MATDQAWADRDTFLSCFSILDNSLNNFKIHCQKMKQLKVEVFDDPTRRADLEALLAEDENNSYTEWSARYLLYKSMYDALQPLIPAPGWPLWADL